MESLKIELNAQSLTEAKEYIENRLKDMGQPNTSVTQSVIVFEELFMGAVRQCGKKPVSAKLAVENRFGEVTVKLLYEGDRFLIENSRSEKFSVEIMNGFRDRFFIGYRRGMNVISIRVQNSRRAYFLLYAAILLLALIVSHILKQAGPSATDFIGNYLVTPILRLMLNAVLLISTPLAFFSLLNNSITLISSNRRRTASGRIIKTVFLQAAVAVAISMLAGVLLSYVTASPYEEYYSAFQIEDLEKKINLDFVGFFFPSDIGEFFSLTKPFAFIGLALLTALAICNSEEHFDTLQHAVSAISELLVKILNIVLTILPIAYFAAVLDDVLFFSASDHILGYLVLSLYMLMVVAVLFGIYCLQIKCRGGKPIEFIRKSMPAIKENLLIGSSIDAAPYNIRFYSKTFHIPIKDLSDNLPILAQVSQAGNCLCFGLISMAYLFLCNVEFSPLRIVIIAVMSFFLGIGSPGQQGGILSGTIIIIAFLGLPIEDVISMAIICELLFGQLATFVDTWGDLVIEYTQYLRKRPCTNKKNRSQP